MKKRILSILLAVCITICLMPASVFAATQTVDSWSGLQNLMNSTNNLSVTLLNDISWGGESLTVPAGKNVTLDLNGKAIDAQSNGTVIVVNGTLTIKNSGADLAGPIGVGAGPITGNIKNGRAVSQKAGGIFVADGAKLVMNSGWLINCLDDSKEQTSAGGIYVSKDAEFEMAGGIITGCTGSSSPYILCASGVVNYGTFTMRTNATISGSKSLYGNDGVAICNAGTFNASGGTVQTGQSCRNYDKIQNTAKSSTIFYCDVLNTGLGTISGGTYSYPVENYGTITDGKFDGNVTSSGTINGGTFNNGTVDNTGIVTGGVFNGNKNGIYTVAFDSGVPSQIRANAPAEVPDAPTRKGCTFKCWLKDGMPYDFTQNVTENIFLTADWTNKSYTVKFDTDGGTVVADKTVNWNDSVLDGVTAPSKPGYDFKGWTYNGRTVSAGTSYSSLAADDNVESITLTAQWTAETYGITIVDKSGKTKEINSVNKDDVLGDGTVKFAYDKTSKKGTLTLNNANLSSNFTFPINADGIDVLEIVLIGKNELYADADICIAANDLIFSGEGSIDISVGEYTIDTPAVDCYGKITVNGGTVNINGKDYAIWTDETVTVNDGSLTIAITNSSGTALDSTAYPAIRIASDMILLTGNQFDGSDSTVTNPAENDTIVSAAFIKVMKKHSHCICGKNAYDGHGSHEDIEWIPWMSANSLPAKAGNYYFVNDVNLPSGEFTLPDGVNLCLNGKSVKGEYYGGSKLNASGALGITDCGMGSIGEISLTGNSANLTMYNGKIAENTTLVISGGAAFTMTGNAQNDGRLLIYDDVDFTMNGNAVNNCIISLHETDLESKILFGGHAKGGYVSVQQPRYGAGFKMIGDAQITRLEGFNYNIFLTMEDNSLVGDVSINFTHLSLSGKAKLGSKDSSFTIGERNLVLKDDVQLIGSVTFDTSENNAVLTLNDRASINGELSIKNKGGQSTSAKLVMSGDSVIYGKLLCTDSAVSFEMQENAKIDGTMDVGQSKVYGTITCTGEIVDGIFDENGTVINNGRIIGGIFYGTVTGTGTIEDTAKRTLTFEPNGGTIASEKRSASVLRGQKVQIPTGCKKDGYTLTGWNKGDKAYDFSAPVLEDITLTAQWKANVYTVKFNLNGGSAVDDKSLGWNDKVLEGISNPTRDDGYIFVNWKYGDTIIDADATYAKLVENDTVKSITLTAQWRDAQKPTGEIIIKTNIWNKFLNDITFGLFFKETQTVTINANDNSGEAVTIKYLLSNTELTEEELKEKTFLQYDGRFSIDPNNEYIIYAKLTDSAGNTSFINSTGIVLDSKAPVISGIENGKTYCEAQTVTITEKYVYTVKVNEIEIKLDKNSSFVLAPANGKQEIVVIDKAGNIAKMIVTVNDGHTYGEWASNGDGTHTRKCTVDGCTAGIQTENCADENKDHKCDNCHITLSECADTNKDHICEYCGKEISNHEDINNDHVCDYCGNVITNHTGGKATCKDKAVCEVCGKSYGELDANDHASLKHIDAKAATKDSEGNIEYWYCEGCDKYYSDAAATKEITQAETITKKLPNTPKPSQTGDNSNFIMQITLLLISIGACAALVVKRKKITSAHR